MVLENEQNYEVVLARDIALSRSKDAQWTSCEFNTFREWDKQLVYKIPPIPLLYSPSFFPYLSSYLLSFF